MIQFLIMVDKGIEIQRMSDIISIKLYDSFCSDNFESSYEHDSKIVIKL